LDTRQPAAELGPQKSNLKICLTTCSDNTNTILTKRLHTKHGKRKEWRHGAPNVRKKPKLQNGPQASEPSKTCSNSSKKKEQTEMTEQQKKEAQKEIEATWSGFTSSVKAGRITN
jgi:hypothetical protein